jgi:hypothetical protein
MRQPKVEKAFENLCSAARWAGIDTTGLSFNTGSKVNGIAYRIYRLDLPHSGHSEWPYAPPGGFLGMTAGEAIKTLDTMRYVFNGMAIVKAQQEYDARKEAQR